MNDLLLFYQENANKLFGQLLEHIGLTLSSVALACALSIPLGIYIAHHKRIAASALNVAGILQTIPSIALLGFLIPILGIGIQPAIFALFLYSILPILRNVYTGIRGIDQNVLDSAKGMGMSPQQILWKVELPLAMPTLLAGIRTATVINVGVATLAAYIAAGGLGEFIFGGIALNNSTMIIAGALPAALLAIVLDFLLSLLQRKKNLKPKRLSLLAALALLLGISAYGFKQNSLSSLTAGFAPEFIGRADGLPALKKTYGLDIEQVVLGPGLMYKAVNEGAVDVISGYSTDGRIKSYHLRVLEDDLNSFPPYQAALLVNGKTWSKHRSILNPVFSKLEGKINDSTMTYLNYRVDAEKESPSVVARDFLKELGLYQQPKDASGDILIMGSKIFGEQYILVALYEHLIEGYSNFKVETKLGLGGTKICFDALQNGEIDFYPEYSGTALQVLLKQENDTPNPEQVFTNVQRDLSTQFNLHFTEPLGFNNTYALMMREAQAKALDISTVSGLVKHLK
jgi:osmoprotectant transport system permease protein